MDQRVQQTRNTLQASMRELLGRTTWDTITIKMLCENASISRTTFYANFRSKDELLDSLLLEFERAMQSDNNGRSLATTGSFRFLPILVSHVSSNRELFSQTSTAVEGFPVADKFRRMIDRLTSKEAQQAYGDGISPASVYFIAGGIYRALVHWSATSKEATHLKLLVELDLTIRRYLRLEQSKPGLQGLWK